MDSDHKHSRSDPNEVSVTVSLEREQAGDGAERALALGLRSQNLGPAP